MVIFTQFFSCFHCETGVTNDMKFFHAQTNKFFKIDMDREIFEA